MQRIIFIIEKIKKYRKRPALAIFILGFLPNTEYRRFENSTEIQNTESWRKKNPAVQNTARILPTQPTFGTSRRFCFSLVLEDFYFHQF